MTKKRPNRVMDRYRQVFGWFAPYSRMASRYLLFSLVIALLPLGVLSLLYDNYVVELIEKVTDQKNTSQIVAYENTVQHFLKERAQELDDLKAQFDQQIYYDKNNQGDLVPELEAIVRVLVDTKYIYGVVFYDDAGDVVRSFPSEVAAKVMKPSLPKARLDELHVIGPYAPENGLPSWFILKSGLKTKFNEQGIGFVLRFATMTSFMGDLTLPGLREPYLKAPDGRFYDTAGFSQTLADDVVLREVVEIIPGWQMFFALEEGYSIPEAKQVRYFLIFTALVTALVILYLNYSISHRMNRQIDHLVRRVERVAHGDINTPLKVAGTWEIHNLSLSIESMRNQLQTFIRSNLEMERRASLGQMAAGVAHEVRNPLATINTAVQALSKTEKDPEKLELMEIMSDEISRTNTVIADLLDYARPRDPQPEAVSVTELIEHTKVLADVVAKKQQAQIVLSIPSRDMAPMTVFGDAVHLRQVLLNLVLNALQAMENITPALLTISARVVKGRCEITIKDVGEGMDEQQLERILEPFFTTKSNGTGLGLSICSSLIARNNGVMTFESEKGKGTQVRLSLPMNKWGNDIGEGDI